LLVHRQDHKPQGNTWANVAGKVDSGETPLSALVREIEEEVGLKVTEGDCVYSEQFYVRHSGYDFIYHIYHLLLKERLVPVLNFDEHKDHKWITPQDALLLDLILDEDFCIKEFYNLD
jgi:8-oxo-dGTP pyrophosphatase MutT (NUDIX family)